MDRDTVALIVCAGRSQRMGEYIHKYRSKLLLPLKNGKTVIEETISRIALSEYITSIVCICPRDIVSEFETLLVNHNKELQNKNIYFTYGGLTRFDSVYSGLNFIEQKKLPGNTVLIHDGARCLVDPNDINRCVEHCQTKKAVTLAAKSIDTLKITDKDLKIIGSLNRESIWHIKTPQVFQRDLILGCHQQLRQNATEEDLISVTDDSSVVEKFYDVYILEGGQQCIKVTTPTDIRIVNESLE
jgi:2-C-methyl-D-erythritol 4-phosphate cytidylyltransferase